MQSLRKSVQELASVCATNLLKQPAMILPKVIFPASAIHTSSNHMAGYQTGGIYNLSRFLNYNKKMYPPQGPDEERRLAFVCHAKADIKYSPKKMWYIACLVRGMSVDEAIKQLSHVDKKGASAVKETILEAQKMAVEQHNVEFKSNLWVAESFCNKSYTIKGIRRHARGRVGRVDYRYVHYFVRLEEGKPPANYYQQVAKNKEEHLEAYMRQMRSRKIYNSL